MRKAIIFCLLFALISPMVLANVSRASINDDRVVGRTYLTDIKAYFNEIPIKSYNIGGYTVVFCKDLINYGFDVYDLGYGNFRIISSDNFTTDKKSMTIINDKKIRRVYESEGDVYFNNGLIPSYRINGETVIKMEDLSMTVGCRVGWNPVDRTISVNSIQTGEDLEISKGVYEVTRVQTDFLVGRNDDLLVDNTIYNTESELIKFYTGTIDIVQHNYLLLNGTMQALGLEITIRNNLLDIATSSTKTNEEKVVLEATDITFTEPEGLAYLCKVNIKFNDIIESTECLIYKDSLYISTADLEKILSKAYIDDFYFASYDTWPALINEAEWIYWNADIQSNSIEDVNSVDYWISSTMPVCLPSGRSVPILEPHQVGEEVSIAFCKEMDEISFTDEHIKIILEKHDNNEVVDVTDKVVISYNQTLNKLYFDIDYIQWEKYDSMVVVMTGLRNSFEEEYDGSMKFGFSLF